MQIVRVYIVFHGKLSRQIGQNKVHAENEIVFLGRLGILSKIKFNLIN